MGIAIPARAKIDNIGGEGQFILGALGAFWVANSNPNLHPVILITCMFLAGFLFLLRKEMTLFLPSMFQERLHWLKPNCQALERHQNNKYRDYYMD